MADARSLLSLLLLCATCGTVVDLEVAGEDEDQAHAALASALEANDPDASDDEETHTSKALPAPGKTPLDG